MENNMTKKLVYLLLLVALVFGAFYIYKMMQKKQVVSPEAAVVVTPVEQTPAPEMPATPAPEVPAQPAAQPAVTK